MKYANDYRSVIGPTFVLPKKAYGIRLLLCTVGLMTTGSLPWILGDAGNILLAPGLLFADSFLLRSDTNARRSCRFLRTRRSTSPPRFSFVYSRSPFLALSQPAEGWTCNDQSPNDNATTPAFQIHAIPDRVTGNQSQGMGHLERDETKPNFIKSHSVTVCIVPPPPTAADGRDSKSLESDGRAWTLLTEIRLRLKDPGFFRWPPHVNLLYPFIQEDQVHECNVSKGSAASDSIERCLVISNTILRKLRRAAKTVEPFWISIDLGSFRTFGDSTRGVLWTYPNSFRRFPNETTFLEDQNRMLREPIVELQALLEQEFPMCSEALKSRNFIPHMTLSSKFGSTEDAKAAAAGLNSAFNSTQRPCDESFTRKNEEKVVTFLCDKIYVLERDGDHGQFQRRATIALGKGEGDLGGSGIQFHSAPKSFRGMPAFEAEWVRIELEALKAKRKLNRKKNSQRKRNGGNGVPRLSYRARKRRKGSRIVHGKLKTYFGGPRHHDLPEDVVRKRAERKARRTLTSVEKKSTS